MIPVPRNIRCMTAIILWLWLLTRSVVVGQEGNTTSTSYTCYDDASWSIRTDKLSSLLGDKQALYDRFLETCRQAIRGGKARGSCAETQRLHMNRDQPMSMRNYTRVGYAKIRAPDQIIQPLFEFWERNKHLEYTEWQVINTYHNMWEAPTGLIHVANESLTGGGDAFQHFLWEQSRHVLEQWTGQRLAPCSMWGVRIYKNNSILTPHVDRLPLVSSAIINIAQDVDEPWPLEVYGHDGVAVNVTMEPGDMVLYESHSIIHGRPFPMNGRYYANIFVHFEPLGALGGSDERDSDLPPYVVPNTPWAAQWRKDNPKGWELLFGDPVTAAKRGDLRTLENVAMSNPEALEEEDDIGWRPIHECARSGHLPMMELLLENDVNINHRCPHGTPLYLAQRFLGPDHAVTKLLQRAGGISQGPYDGAEF